MLPAHNRKFNLPILNIYVKVFKPNKDIFVKYYSLRKIRKEHPYHESDLLVGAWSGLDYLFLPGKRTGDIQVDTL